MVPPAASVAARNARRVLDFAVQRGLPEARSPRLLERGSADDAARVPSAQMYDLWERMAQTLRDPELPIRLAHESRLEDLGVLGFAVLTAPTLGEALGTFVKYSALLSDDGRWHLVLGNKHAQLHWQAADSDQLGVRASRETSLAQATGAIRQLCGVHFEPLSVSFRHPAPSSTRAHAALFRCPVEFEGQRNGLVVPRELLREQPPGSNAALWQYLCQQADLLLAQLPPPGLTSQVRHLLEQGLATSAAPSLDQLARALGMSERSLRRALATEGHGFRALLDSVRRARASALLKQPGSNVTRAAFECGFRDAASFTHACKRWFGRAPSILLHSNVPTPD